ncbi:MAG TPA: asparaginase [Beijerinckiaceae bacterium]|jgi:L-asparaginase II
MRDQELVEVWRGGSIESIHRGSLVVVDARGATVLALGDPDQAVFPRSAIKALQALPLIEDGAAEIYGLTDAEIALACASHSGEPEHVATSAGMLRKAGRDPACLECGAQWPMGEAAARALAARGETPTALNNNCSGKHAGFVCLACAADEDPKGYVGADHPVQRRVRQVLDEVTGAAHDIGQAGIDGCSIPTYPIPLRALALGFARFGAAEGLSPDRARAAGRIRRAVAAHPFMVAGTGRFDTQLMERLGERAFVKTGAEGVYAATFPELGLGVALKCSDGATRASAVIMAALVERFLPLADEDARFVDALARPQLTNWNGFSVGRLTPTAALLA